MITSRAPLIDRTSSRSRLYSWSAQAVGEGFEISVRHDTESFVRSGHDVSVLTDQGLAVPIADMARVRAILVDAAKKRCSFSYSEALLALGHRFTRPKMRAFCKTLDAIDALAQATSEPDLAVLVVRESDGLPGQGWWVGGRTRLQGYDGPWSGAEAAAFVRGLQELAFDYWGRKGDV